MAVSDAVLQNKNTTTNSICSPAKLTCLQEGAVESMVNCTESAATTGRELQFWQQQHNNDNKKAFPWVSHIMSLSFSFLICKMGLIMPISKGCLGMKYDDTI